MPSATPEEPFSATLAATPMITHAETARRSAVRPMLPQYAV